MSLKILAVIEKNSWMKFHIAESLELMGNHVTCFYYGDCVGKFYGPGRYAEQREKNIALLNFAKNLRDTAGLDLIFCYVHDDFLLPKYAKALSNLNISMVNYNVDMPTHWFRQIRTAKYFDMMLCGQRDNMQHLARYAKKVFYFPMAARMPAPNNTFAQSEKTEEVTFLGMAHPFRERILSQLAELSVPLSIFGKYWESSQPNIYKHNLFETLSYMIHYSWPRFKTEGLSSLWKAFLNRFFIDHRKKVNAIIPKEIIKGEFLDNNLSVLFYRSKINIGFTRYAGSNPDLPGRCQMKLRDFEVPMAGGFYLVEKAPGYDEAFLDGMEVVTWQTFPELLEKINYYLRHDHEREQIAAAGRKRALQDHTWEKRFNILFSELGLPLSINGI